MEIGTLICTVDSPPVINNSLLLKGWVWGKCGSAPCLTGRKRVRGWEGEPANSSKVHIAPASQPYMRAVQSKSSPHSRQDRLGGEWRQRVDAKQGRLHEHMHGRQATNGNKEKNPRQCGAPVCARRIAAARATIMARWVVCHHHHHDHHASECCCCCCCCRAPRPSLPSLLAESTATQLYPEAGGAWCRPQCTAPAVSSAQQVSRQCAQSQMRAQHACWWTRKDTARAIAMHGELKGHVPYLAS